MLYFIISSKILKKVNKQIGDKVQIILSTAPRGWNIDRPEIELLQLRKMAIHKYFTIDKTLTPDFVDKVKITFGNVKKFNQALDKYVGASRIEKKW